jgi:hypothetical protein
MREIVGFDLVLKVLLTRDSIGGYVKVEALTDTQIEQLRQYWELIASHPIANALWRGKIS